MNSRRRHVGVISVGGKREDPEGEARVWRLDSTGYLVWVTCSWHGFVLGKVYAVGGHDGNEHLGNMEMFDPLTNKWMMKASMNTKRYISIV